MSSPKDSQEWTKVSRKSRKNKSKSTNSNSIPSSSRSHTDVRMNVVPNTENIRTPAELEASYRRCRERWESEPSCAKVRELITSKASHLNKINRAVNFGVGTFDPKGAYDPKASFVQLAAFDVIVEELGKITDEKMETYIQDPMFSASDKTFLGNLGHTVVEEPAGNDLVTPTTFFFGVHLYKGIYKEAFEKHLPALFIGTGWNAWDNMLSPNGLEEIHEIHKTYGHCEFPEDKYDTAFSTTSIYWKATGEQEDEKGESVKDKDKGKVEEAESEKVAIKEEEEDELSKKLESTTIS
ncbi:sensitivity to red light reduced- srr1 [Fusarium langsethiae]|uniref:Sensitivity to red light reduced-srr1 n=1 Tax=Fusarium langsethiae TaxID=179993 RepID=A0A0M9EW79_FUSLA|nr:sensitivity to red light reduced- srr1 [Fusarium langsethiae]GKU03876.1 unnamed protein product [Fusarium langsethiae]GKU16344.1 unnamed protein product [Fusarium langsethiae]